MLNSQFGSGVLYGIPNAGNLTANPTPMQFGILQEVSIDFKGDVKKLYGMQQLPLKAARGKITATSKGKIASLDPSFYSQLFFGQNATTGTNHVAINEQHTSAASVPTTNVGATQDLGVVAVNSVVSGCAAGTQLTAIKTGTPTTGQYLFTPGASSAYTFASADVTAGLIVDLNYVYPVLTSGITLSVTNQLMGFAPQFTALLWNAFGNQQFSIQLNACIMTSLSIPTKNEDFWISDFEMEAFADASNNFCEIYSDQA